MMTCPNCHKPADLTVKVDRPGKTAKVIAAHKAGHDGPWLRDTLITKSYERRLLKALADECKAESSADA